MGLLMGALAGAGAAIERTTGDALRAMVEEEKAMRIAEYTGKLRSDEDLMKRGRDKADVGEERERVKGMLTEPVTVRQGDGMLAPSSGDLSELESTTREPTNSEMVGRALKAGDLKTAADVGKLDDKDAANAIKMQIAQGRFENAIQIAQMKGDFGMMIGELKAASKNGSEKATELMRNITALKGMGKSDKEAIDLLLGGKVGEYTTTATESVDTQGNEVVTTKKVKPGSEQPTAANSRASQFKVLR